METVKAGRSEPWYMLDNAEACLAVLTSVEQRLVQEHEADTPPLEQTQKISTEDMQAQAEAALSAAEQPLPELHATAVIPMPVVADDAEHIDPELLEIFIEEAKEEIASIKRHLPAWVNSPDDMEMLITVRRSFTH